MATDLPQIARVSCEGTFNAERFVNVLHFQFIDVSPPTQSDLTDLLDILCAASSNQDSVGHLYNVMDAQLLVDTVTATTLDLTTPIQEIRTTSIAGASVGADMPPMLSIVVRWGTPVANRRSRGRTYFTGINTNFVDSTNSDRVTALRLSEMNTKATEFMNTWRLSTSLWRFVILSETARREDVPTPYSEVSSASVNPLLCVQRRRRERLI